MGDVIFIMLAAFTSQDLSQVPKLQLCRPGSPDPAVEPAAMGNVYVCKQGGGYL